MCIYIFVHIRARCALHLHLHALGQHLLFTPTRYPQRLRCRPTAHRACSSDACLPLPFALVPAGWGFLPTKVAGLPTLQASFGVPDGWTPLPRSVVMGWASSARPLTEPSQTTRLLSPSHGAGPSRTRCLVFFSRRPAFHSYQATLSSSK